MKKIMVLLASLAMSLTVMSGTAVAATKYSNCDSLHKAFPNGVAKTRQAARYQVRHGNARPAVKYRVYNSNTSLDRDKDRTACEVAS